MDKNYAEFRCTEKACGYVEMRYKAAKYCSKCRSPIVRTNPPEKKIHKKRVPKAEKGKVVLTASFDPLIESTVELLEYLAACAARVAEYIGNDILPAVMKVMAEYRQSAYHAYLEAGAPYGGDDEGFLVWLKELHNPLDQEEGENG